MKCESFKIPFGNIDVAKKLSGYPHGTVLSISHLGPLFEDCGLTAQRIVADLIYFDPEVVVAEGLAAFLLSHRRGYVEACL